MEEQPKKAKTGFGCAVIGGYKYSMLKKELYKYQIKAASNIHGGCCIGWLGAHCSCIDDILAILKGLGFHISWTVKIVTENGETYRWVETVDGICVFVNFHGKYGFVTKRFSLWR